MKLFGRLPTYLWLRRLGTRTLLINWFGNWNCVFYIKHIHRKTSMMEGFFKQADS